MQKVGIGFILTAVALLMLFVIDALVSPGNRFADDIDTMTLSVEKVEVDEVDPPVKPDPFWDLEHLERKDILSSSEMDLVHRGADYEYAVREGDTIDDLARKYLGHHTLKSVLYDFNPHLQRGDRLNVGHTITIPFRYRR